jgi:diguanylate cyclase (GGDEF)-like protein
VSSESSSKRSDGQLLAAGAAAVSRADDLDDALAQLLGLAAEHVGASLGAAYIFDQDRDELELTVTSGIEAEVAADAASIKPVSESPDALAGVTRSRRPMPVDDASRVPILSSAATALLVPLVVRREGVELALGVLALGFPGPLPSPKILAGAEPLADLAAVAVERALAISLASERAEWFDRLAHTDPLTGLANRRTLDRMLELEAARAGRQGVPLSLALIEIDRLNEIQKAGGNEAGDAALKRVAQVLAESVRLVDTIGRFSAGQFMLLTPGPDGVVVVERLIRGVARQPVKGKRVTVSAGVANYPVDGRTPEELLEIAERTLAEARRAGGSRVVAQPAPSE